MATAQTIINNARTDMAMDPGKELWSDTQLLRYLNEGLSFLYAKSDFKFRFENATFSLVASQANYSYAADFGKLLWAKRIDGDATSTESDESTLDIITDDLATWQQSVDLDKTGDIPQYIYEEGGEFKVWPIPNATAAARWTIEYQYSEYPTTLTTTDTPGIPAQWHFVLEHYVRYRAFASKPGSSMKTFAADALSEWEKWSAKAVADMLARQNEDMTYYMPKLPSKPLK